MPDTITPNFGLIKPEVTGSVDTWGSKLNGNYDILDTQLEITDTTAQNSVQRSGVVANRTAADLLLYADTVADPSLVATPLALMTNRAVRALLNALCPVGTIIMWGGSVASIPAGWGLCDGTVQNGVTTPNMLGRFIIGAASTGITPGTSGGSSTLSYSGLVGGHALSYNEMPQHTHVINDPSHSHSVADPTHAHVSQAGPPATQGFGDTGGRVAAAAGALTTYAATGISLYAGYSGVYNSYSGYSWAHDHPIAFAIAGPAWFPPFYAVVYMMRIAAF